MSLFDDIFGEIAQRHRGSSVEHMLHHVLANQYLIKKKLDKIMATELEVLQQISDAKAVAQKTQATLVEVKTKVGALETAINNAPKNTIPDSVSAALTGLKSALDSEDASASDLDTFADNTPAPVDTTPVDTTPADGSGS